MTIEAKNIKSGTIEPWMTLSPEQDITAYDLWRCFSLGQSLDPDEAKGIPAELIRHYKSRPPPGVY